jgi:hypothetical protein
MRPNAASWAALKAALRGGPVTGYHGSDVLDRRPTSIRDRVYDFGPGFYFALNADDARGYNPFVNVAEIALSNPLVFSPDDDNPVLARRILKALGMRDVDIEDTFGLVGHRLKYAFSCAMTLADVGTISGHGLLKFLQKLGYDGVYVDPRVLDVGARDAYVAVYSPEQILSWRRLA